MKTILFTEDLTYRDIRQYLRKSNLAILPIGTLEVHGYDLPLGTDSIIAIAFSRVLAKKTGALVFPHIPYSFADTLNKFKGTISIEVNAVFYYVKGVCQSLIENGFSRILLVGIHNRNELWIPHLVAELFSETRVPVAYLNPYTCVDSKFDKKIFGRVDKYYKESSLALGSLKILGREFASQPSVEAKRKEKFNQDLIRRIRQTLVVSYLHTDPNAHIPFSKGVKPEQGIEYLEKVADKVIPLINDLSEYVVLAKRIRRMKV